jgi:serine/threonine protein kinase
MTSQTCLECGLALGPEMAFCPACGNKISQQAQEEAERLSQSHSASAGYEGMEAAFPLPPGSAPDVKEMVRTALPKPGDVLGGNLRLLKYLGAGSLCATYSCESTEHPGAIGVLKLLQPRKAADPILSEDFLFLAKSVSRYRHPSVARILDARRQDGDVFYTMEWLQGSPLRMWLLDRLAMDTRVLPGLDLFLRLLDAFREIHEHGCYGCLKPENIFVTERGPVVVDFGVPGFLTAQEFEFNAYARRYLPYMAPELRQQWSNLVPQSDIYSLGAILYEILLGRPPAWPLKLPSDVSPHFGIDADEIIQRAMAPQPFDRFSSIDAFQEAVGGLIQNIRRQMGEPEPARPTAPRPALGRKHGAPRSTPPVQPEAYPHADASEKLPAQNRLGSPQPSRAPSADHLQTPNQTSLNFPAHNLPGPGHASADQSQEPLPEIRDEWTDATSEALESALGGDSSSMGRGVASPYSQSSYSDHESGEGDESSYGSAQSPYGKPSGTQGFKHPLDNSLPPQDEDLEEGGATPAWAYALLAVLAATLCALAAIAGMNLTP